MNKFTVTIALIFAFCATSIAADAPGTPFKLSIREQTFLEQKVCGAQYNLKASKIKAYAFEARKATDGKIGLEARTNAYVECASHGDFMGKPMHYIDDCDLVDGEWDCSPPQLEVVVPINGRDVKMRPWGGLTPEKSYALLKDISTRGRFQGESLDKAIGNSCDIAKNKDPDIVELGCEATMSISYWCPQTKITGCPRVLFLSFDEPALMRRQ
ncbi:hypothetical protein GCM10011613_36290 [Cellvibrio zantedeschiae]|uniref:Uncharacterized protein n=1 Tax=Cellvibrio zantedeschiae TaxID=1237077 RepID=A0ABQ3BAE6_9GAMM|nr:hypothetical protein [Cellvibrio zantedeschiae]GGY88000.1 hypothetical protein GCM10011613_36290 [Cellvibrio zantedeschiae]